MTLSSVKSIQGRRDYMEDRYSYFKKDDMIIAMVCDGHGGDKVSNLTALGLPELLYNRISVINGTNVSIATEIRNIIIDWGDYLLDNSCGTTLTGILTKGDYVFIYNIGDSHSCFNKKGYIYKLCPVYGKVGQLLKNISVKFETSTFFCTKDHDDRCPDEVQRVQNSGGEIREERLNGVLSMTRAIGDKDVGFGIDHTPDIYWIKKSNVLGPIVMYSDGVYELQRYPGNCTSDFSDEYLYKIADTYGSELLVEYAHRCGSEDNITAIVVNI